MKYAIAIFVQYWPMFAGKPIGAAPTILHSSLYVAIYTCTTAYYAVFLI